MSYYIGANVYMDNKPPQMAIAFNGTKAPEPISFFGLIGDKYEPIEVKKVEETKLGNQVYKYFFKNKLNYDGIKRIRTIDATGMVAEANVNMIPAPKKAKK